MQFWNLIAISSIEHIMEEAYSYFPGDMFIAFISYISAVIIHRLKLLLACSFCVFKSQFSWYVIVRIFFDIFWSPALHTLYTRKLILYISFCTIFQFLEHIVSDYLFLIMLLLLLLNHYVRFSQFLLTFLGKYFNASYRNASGVI